MNNHIDLLRVLINKMMKIYYPRDALGIRLSHLST